MSLTASLVMFLAAGLAGGVLLGLIGVGMALIAVPLLTLTLPLFGVTSEFAPLTALATSMAIVSVGSVSSIVSHHRLGNVDWPVVRTTVLASLTGVALGSLAASHLPGKVLQVIFCMFLLIIATRMLLPAKRSPNAAELPTSALIYRLVGGLIGVAGSLIGAGGSVFMVPFLNSRGHKMIRAVATATTIGLPVSTVGAVIYACQASPVSGHDMLGFIFLPAFAGLSIGSLLAAPFGVKLASRVDPRYLKTGFAIALIAIAVKLML